MPITTNFNKPWTISIAYLVLGVCWIFFSDKAAEYLVSNDIREMSRYQLAKGIFFIFFTSLLLYILIQKLFTQVNNRKLELELLFNNPNLGILKLDEMGYITYVSANIKKITGYHPSELEGKHIIHFTPDEWKEVDLEELKQISESNGNEGFIFSKRILCKNGKVIIIKAYGMKVVDDRTKNTRYIAAFQNITEQVDFLKKLKSQNKKLKEIAFEQSHIVRAPLARIMGITDLLQNFNLDPSEKSKLTANLKTSSEELDNALRGINLKMKKFKR